jgi:hypothetical protein
MCRFCCRWLHGELQPHKFWGWIIIFGVYISYTHFSIGVCVCVLFCRLMHGILRFSLTPSHLLTHTVSAWHPLFYILLYKFELILASECVFVCCFAGRQDVKIDSGSRIALQLIDLEAI